MSDPGPLIEFVRHMQAAKRSPVTIQDRAEFIRRLARWLAPSDLLEALPADLERFQESYSHLSRSSVDIYTRHVRAFYKWAVVTERIERDPTARMAVIRTPKGIPHPTSEADVRLLLATARSGLRLAYVLAAFAGLRCGEITRLRGEDLTLTARQPLASIHGKGGHERTVPLLAPVVAELGPAAAIHRRGVLVRDERGTPYTPERLSIRSCKFMAEIGVESTMHSLRHYFATQVVQMTKDVLLVQQLLGHASLATTQIYMRSTLDGVHDKLAAFEAGAAAAMLN